MQHQRLQFGHGFRVVLGDAHSQAARMTPAPGETEGGPDNCHRGADQWLSVVNGTDVAAVEGERHEVRNTGEVPLRMLNVYIPPAYTGDGDELPAGKP
jgi:hypothetical protein